jgi:hypothetical protein
MEKRWKDDAINQRASKCKISVSDIIIARSCPVIMIKYKGTERGRFD